MSYVNNDALVDTAWVAAHLDDPTVCIVDGSWPLPPPETHHSRCLAATFCAGDCWSKARRRARAGGGACARAAGRAWGVELWTFNWRNY